jgi:DNA mismatch endonuclease (patch repair protein)
MALFKGKGNKSTELAFVAHLKADSINGWRHRLPLPEKPDFCFPKQKVAVFIDGCFWHGCSRCYRRPKSNLDFWDGKVTANRARDRRVNQELRNKGFVVMRIFEHQLKHPAKVVFRIRKALG